MLALMSAKPAPRLRSSTERWRGVGSIFLQRRARNGLHGTMIDGDADNSAQ